MDGCLSLEEDWLCGCVVRDVLLSIVDLSSVISLCLAFFFSPHFLSANNGTAMHQHPQAKHREVRDCVYPHAWNTIQDLWRRVSWNIIRILRLFVSATLKWVTFCDLISSPKLCSNTLPCLICGSQGAEEDGGREPSMMTEPLQARMQIVYLFICLDF